MRTQTIGQELKMEKSTLKKLEYELFNQRRHMMNNSVNRKDQEEYDRISSKINMTEDYIEYLNLNF